MAKLTVLDDPRIVFETTHDERMRGAGFLLFGSGVGWIAVLFLCGGHRHLAPIVIGAVLASVGLWFLGFGLSILLKYERLTLDFRDRTYDAERDWTFFGEKWSGPFDDLDRVALKAKFTQRVRGRGWRGRGWSRSWVVEWVWRDDRGKPFEVSTWEQASVFTKTLPPARDGRLEFLRSLRTLAEKIGVPFHLPLDYLEKIGAAVGEFAR